MQIDDGRVISNFIIQALKNQDLTIYGDGQQIRCFCYVDDLIEGLIKMMENDIVGPVNLGNPYEEITILDLAKTIIELTDSKSKIIFKELPEDDPIKRKPDISLAMNKLKWNPKITLQKGLMETITYFKGLL
jgi:UDP-glucuronate decarboxylase